MYSILTRECGQCAFQWCGYEYACARCARAAADGAAWPASALVVTARLSLSLLDLALLLLLVDLVVPVLPIDSGDAADRPLGAGFSPIRGRLCCAVTAEAEVRVQEAGVDNPHHGVRVRLRAGGLAGVRRGVGKSRLRRCWRSSSA